MKSEQNHPAKAKSLNRVGRRRSNSCNDSNHVSRTGLETLRQPIGAHAIADTPETNDEPAAKASRITEWGMKTCSNHAKNTRNRIRTVVEVLAVDPNPDKYPIKLNLGDPSLTGVLSPHPSSIKAVSDAVRSGKYNGYGPAVGYPQIRGLLARHVSRQEAPVTGDDIILASGCSHALQMAIEVLANPGQNILVPSPGFPLYETLMVPHGIKPWFYRLLPERSWQVDLDHFESLIDASTAAIVINNPSNPSGTVYSRSHLEAILRIADRHKVPIIADEIYGDMVYDGAEFHPLASLRPKVPILTCDGISKRWLVPGWRLGWLIVHDHDGSLSDIRTGLWQLATKIVGPCGPIQGALPTLLRDTDPQFFQRTRDVLSRNAAIVCKELSDVPGIRPIRPYGAMYLMVLIDLGSYKQFETEFDFTQALIREESVYCLPGTAFHYPGALRLVLTYSEEVTLEACRRIGLFCRKHYKPGARSPLDSTLCHADHSHNSYMMVNGKVDLEAAIECHGHDSEP